MTEYTFFPRTCTLEHERHRRFWSIDSVIVSYGAVKYIYEDSGYMTRFAVDIMIDIGASH